MDEARLREKLGQLLAVARGHTEEVEADAVPFAATAGGSAMHQEMRALEDGLDHLRLAIKYLVFDLEATKRENRLLRKHLQ